MRIVFTVFQIFFDIFVICYILRKWKNENR